MTYLFYTIHRILLLKTRFKTACLKVTHSFSSSIFGMPSVFHAMLGSGKEKGPLTAQSWQSREYQHVNRQSQHRMSNVMIRQKKETCGSTQDRLIQIYRIRTIFQWQSLSNCLIIEIKSFLLQSWFPKRSKETIYLKSSMQIRIILHFHVFK